MLSRGLRVLGSVEATRRMYQRRPGASVCDRWHGASRYWVTHRLQPGIGSAPMAVTPWGETDLLRSQKLRPGPGTAPEKVERSQRQRLIAATVAAVGERGYEATRVEDILAIAGVSRNSF